MRLRPARKSDAASLAALSIEVWISTYLRHGVSAFFAEFALSEFTTARFEALLEEGKDLLIVSENRDGIDGYIRLAEGRPAPIDGLSDLEIVTFYVQPRHHGKGIGSALLQVAIDHCRNKDRTEIWLTTNSENAPAIDFYLSKGFRQVGVTDFRIADQAYPNHVLALNLPPLG
ncbi:GNAT family N-acetyltransferase [Ruegeria sp. THAF33]|jgi:ribosomal protein S18 acetylase RimI-like enzyme|uniref:GNAT family N-acetyltransferase n=1 Tax=Ruegeria sp. THAF33 TaxID=2587853 RepID=UPI0012688019|nr:N-acetyltransferase [Ruegeria sp. THAF33]QFT71926.1 Protease synthase and sporulation negative regulatory protein PAI 1 [Ruegeria sp. THAF33]